MSNALRCVDAGNNLMRYSSTESKSVLTVTQTTLQTTTPITIDKIKTVSVSRKSSESKSSEYSCTARVISSSKSLRDQVHELETQRNLSTEAKGKESNFITRLMFYVVKSGPTIPFSDYGERYAYTHMVNRVVYATDMLQKAETKASLLGIKSEADIEGLRRICINRLFQLNYMENLCYNPDKIAIQNKLIANINLLDNPSSSKVITLEDGTTLFTIGIPYDRYNYEGHFVSYEFKKMNGEYYFSVHDRASDSSKVAALMYGNIRFKVGQKSYEKTNLTIKVAKEHLLDPKFIMCLLSRDQQVPYAEIYLHLIEHAKGKIVQTEIELLIERLSVYAKMGDTFSQFFPFSEMTDPGNLTIRLLKFAEHFHSRQIMPTCLESSNTKFENQLASSHVRKGLKYFTIEKLEGEFNAHLKGNLTATLSKLKRSQKEYEQHADLIKEFAAKKKRHLTEKLSRTSPPHNSRADTITLARTTLNKFDACQDPQFLEAKADQQKKMNQKPKGYIVEPNHDLSQYFNLAKSSFLRDADFMLKVIMQHPEHTNPFSQQLVEWFKAWGQSLAYELRNSEEFMLGAIAINPMALTAASERLKNDETFIRQVCTMHASSVVSDVQKFIAPWALIYAVPRIRNDSRFLALLPAYTVNINDEIRKSLIDQLPNDLKKEDILKKLQRPTNINCVIQ